MVRSQRERILRALVDEMAEHGYTATSIARILKRAGVSRETFYEQFCSKEDCFEAGFHWAVEELADTVRAASAEIPDAPPSSATPLARMDRLLTAYFHGLVEDPARAKVFLVEVIAAGPRLSAVRTERQSIFLDMTIDILGAKTDDQRFACRTLVAAISAQVTFKAAIGDFASITALRAPVLELIGRSGDLYGTAAG